MKATLHEGGAFTDHRGTLRFVNERPPASTGGFILLRPLIRR